jgi:hypothetical protein
MSHHHPFEVVYEWVDAIKISLLVKRGICDRNL